jgi:hypothetical protein
MLIKGYAGLVGGLAVIVTPALAAEPTGALLVRLSKAKEHMLTIDSRRSDLTDFLPARTEYNTALNALRKRGLSKSEKALVNSEVAWASKFVLELVPQGGAPVRTLVAGPALIKQGSVIYTKTALGVQPYITPQAVAAAIGPNLYVR